MLVSVPPLHKTRMVSYFPRSEKRKSSYGLTKLHKACSLFPFWLYVLLVSSRLSPRYTGLLAFPRNSQVFSFCGAFAFALPSTCKAPPSLIYIAYSLALSYLLKSLMLSEALLDSTISAPTTTSSAANTPCLVFVIYIFPRILGKAYLSCYSCDLYYFSPSSAMKT